MNQNLEHQERLDHKTVDTMGQAAIFSFLTRTARTLAHIRVITKTHLTSLVEYKPTKMPFTRTSARRSRPRANDQTPTLRREDAEVIYETVDDVELFGGVDIDQVLDFLSQEDTIRSARSAGNRAPQVAVAPAAHLVNGRRIQQEPQLPAYTQTPSANEMIIESTPSERLPTYEEASKKQEKEDGKTEEGMSRATPAIVTSNSY